MHFDNLHLNRTEILKVCRQNHDRIKHMVMTRHLIRVINRKSIDDRGEIAFSLKLNLGVFNENL